MLEIFSKKNVKFIFVWAMAFFLRLSKEEGLILAAMDVNMARERSGEAS